MAAWAGKGRGEGSLLARHLPGEVKPGDVVVGDCNFSVYGLLASLAARGAHDVGVLSGTRRADCRTFSFRVSSRHPIACPPGPCCQR